MLRRQKGSEPDPAQAAQEGGGVLVARVDRGLMRDERDALPPEEGGPATHEHIEA
jgi:hypothetical protein